MEDQKEGRVGRRAKDERHSNSKKKVASKICPILRSGPKTLEKKKRRQIQKKTGNV
jgi:hypothetical protein